MTIGADMFAAATRSLKSAPALSRSPYRASRSAPAALKAIVLRAPRIHFGRRSLSGNKS